MVVSHPHTLTLRVQIVTSHPHPLSLRVQSLSHPHPLSLRVQIVTFSPSPSESPIHTCDLGSEWWSDQTHCDATVKSMLKNKLANRNTEMKPAPLFVHLDHSVGWSQIVKLVAFCEVLATSIGWCT